jgi:hypothetical protein
MISVLDTRTVSVMICHSGFYLSSCATRLSFNVEERPNAYSSGKTSAQKRRDFPKLVSDPKRSPAPNTHVSSLPRHGASRKMAKLVLWIAIDIFFREAGHVEAPVLLLLHGFPSSSFMFRELIPRLADGYRVIAPDLSGFGFTEVPERRKYT